MNHPLYGFWVHYDALTSLSLGMISYVPLFGADLADYGGIWRNSQRGEGQTISGEFAKDITSKTDHCRINHYFIR